MAKSQVFWTDFRTKALGDGLPTKLKKLALKAGIDKIDMKGKYVAIKIHFGEKGNISFLRPNYARAIVDLVKELGGKPFLTDCNTMYVGYRNNALDHLECAWENGFTPMTVGCPLLIADGLRGLDDVEVPIKGGTHLKVAKIGRAIMDADIVISLNHFKGHESAGFGGAIKNLGMGSGSRAGKCDQHSGGIAHIDEELCVGCKRCLGECANNGLVFNDSKKKMTVDKSHCVGCGRCLGACNANALYFEQESASKDLNEKMAEYAKAVVDGRPNFHLSLICDVSPNCDCHPENDAPIIPDIGMFASFDPVALDKACVDMALKQKPFDNTVITDNEKKGVDMSGNDHFTHAHPGTEWISQLNHGANIGLGSLDYELIEM